LKEKSPKNTDRSGNSVELRELQTYLADS